MLPVHSTVQERQADRHRQCVGRGRLNQPRSSSSGSSSSRGVEAVEGAAAVDQQSGRQRFLLRRLPYPGRHLAALSPRRFVRWDGGTGWDTLYTVADARRRNLMSFSGARVSMFRAGFHTGYVPSGVLRLTKAQLDGSNADPRYDDDFFIDLIFAPVTVANSDGESGLSTGAGATYSMCYCLLYRLLHW